MKKIKLVVPIFFGLLFSTIFNSCTQKEGCTDINATNFDADAEKNDGSCLYDSTVTGPFLIFKFQFDETQPRLNSFGQPAVLPATNAAQNPQFNSISAHYVEMIPSPLTLLGAGEIIYQGEETNAGGANAIDFSKANIVAENEEFLSVPLSAVAAGSYEYVRVSVSYQNYDIVYNALGFTGLQGTLASFVGFNNYLETYTVAEQELTINDDKLQGYWAFESNGTITQGQAPAGAVTVVNPLFNTSPIPAGSCLVTGELENTLTISGNETEDVVVILSVSTNNSFEWTDLNGNGQYDPLDGDVPVDMGLRGMKAIVE